MLKKYRL